MFAKKWNKLLFVTAVLFCLMLFAAAAYADTEAALSDPYDPFPCISCELSDGGSATVTISSLTASDECQFGLTAGNAGWYHLKLELETPLDSYRVFHMNRIPDTQLDQTYYNDPDGSVINIYISMEQNGSCVFGLAFFNNPDSVTLTASFHYVGIAGYAGPDICSIYDESDGALILYGKGEMMDYPSEEDVPWYENRSQITSVIIGNQITHIGDRSFLGCSSVTDVSIPDTAASIGNRAFSGCSSLGSITLPEGLESIGEMGFAWCSSLKELLVPESVTSTENFTFVGCSSLTNVILNGGLTRLDAGMFNECTSLESVTIPDSVEAIGSGAFDGCTSLCDISIPDSVKTVEEDAFLDCTSLKKVTVPASVTDIREYAFGYHLDDINKVPMEDFTICGYPGSEAEEYASANGIHFEPIGCSPHSFGPDGFCTECGEFIFTDVPASAPRSQQYVSWAYENEIVKGISENTFSPDDSCTRIQFIMMLWKMHGSPTKGLNKVENPFSDIAKGTKTEKAIKWALKTGVINSAETFNPDGEITRSQIVMILYKLAGSPKVKTTDNPFTDVTGNKLTKAVLWAKEKGITKGTSDTTFSPNEPCKRLELVIFLYKYGKI